MVLLIFYLALAIGISFLCSILEAVILSVNISFVQIKIGEGKKTARLLKSQKENIGRPLSAILTLNTIAHTVGAAGVGAQAVAVFGEAYFGVISAVLTILILLFSEVIPKTIGARFWKQLALPSASIIQILVYVLYPLVWVSELFTRMIVKKKNTQSVTREDIEVLTKLGTKEGVFQKDEGKLIANILKLKSIKVKSILTPRIVVKGACEDISLGELFKDKEVMKFSRIPIYSESLEDCNSYVLKDEILEGLVNGKDSLELKELKRSIIIVPENVFIYKLFEQFLNEKEHLAAVVDEYGGFEGIVSMEDIIETILGLEILDESDTHEDMQKLAMEKWEIKAKRMNLDWRKEE